MKEKGFTLIELLAVIVILAIIALIAVPIVLNIIEDAKNESNQRSVDLYGTAVKNAAAKYQLANTQVDLTGAYDSNEEGTELTHQDTNKGITLTVEYDGARVYCETIEISSTGEVSLDKCKVNGNSVDNSYGEIEEDDNSETNLEQGLYNENNEMVMSWSELLEEGILVGTSNIYAMVSMQNMNGVRYAEDKLVGKLVIPNTVKAISGEAFIGCNNLTEVVIPDSVTSIGYYAFNGCSSLTSITLPKNLKTISEGVFNGCTNLTELTIPDSVTSIDGSMGSPFSNSGIKNITLSSGLTSISYGVFDGCTNLETVTIPNSVTNIEMRAFNGCTNLTTINYMGTTEQWSAITIDNNYNEPLTNATINYNYALQ